MPDNYFKLNSVSSRASTICPNPVGWECITNIQLYWEKKNNIKITNNKSSMEKNCIKKITGKETSPCHLL